MILTPTVWSPTDYQNAVKMFLSKIGDNIQTGLLEYDTFGKPEDMNGYDALGQPHGGSNASLSSYVIDQKLLSPTGNAKALHPFWS